MSDLFIGTDIIDVERIKRTIVNYKVKFVNRVYSIEEQDYCNSKSNPEIHYAGRFAAKEAIFKAIKSCGFKQSFNFKDIKIINQLDGSPYVVLGFDFEGDLKVSISHTQFHAVAFALLKINPK